MNRKEAKELMPIIQAFAEGKTIQYYDSLIDIADWEDCENPNFENLTYEFRIKPEPTYRPFKDAEECWAEMLKHQPFGWVKSKDGSTINKFMFIDSLNNDEVTIRTSVRFTYSELVKYYIFADGTPFGIRE